MTVDEMIVKLNSLSEDGYGKHEVCYLYEEDDVPVRDSIKYVEVADSADGEEVHMWQ